MISSIVGEPERTPMLEKTQAQDPHDPLALRPDEAWFGRWRWRGRLYQRNRDEGRRILRGPLIVVLAVALVIAIGLIYVLVAGPVGGAP